MLMYESIEDDSPNRYQEQKDILEKALDVMQNRMIPVDSDDVTKKAQAQAIHYVKHLIRVNEELSRGFMEFEIDLNPQENL